jgi:hypothetical protein
MYTSYYGIIKDVSPIFINILLFSLLPNVCNELLQHVATQVQTITTYLHTSYSCISLSEQNVVNVATRSFKYVPRLFL